MQSSPPPLLHSLSPLVYDDNNNHEFNHHHHENFVNNDMINNINIRKSFYTKNTSNTQNRLMQFSNSNCNFNSIPVTPSCLLGTFEESLLNGRMQPVGFVDGFYADLGASGSFFPPHESLPVNASFYQVCEDVAASPYLVGFSLSSILISKMD